MKKKTVNKIQPAQQQQPTCTSDYRKLLRESFERFENKIRETGLRTFNIYLWLESEYKKEIISNSTNRKPPTARTIKDWLLDDPVSTAKLGADDLIFLCVKVKDPVALMAYFDSAMSRFNIRKEIVLDDTHSLTRRLHVTSILIGKLYEEYDRDNEDGNIDKAEAGRILGLIDILADHLSQIRKTLETK